MITGGLRRRIIKDNLYYMIYDSLTSLGWLGSSLTLSDYPVTLVAEQIDPQTEITPNKVGISTEDIRSFNIEMGSNLEQYNWSVYIDIFAEDEPTGIHLSGDIYDIIAGKMESINRTGPVLDVYDYFTDGEPYLFSCQLENLQLERVREWDKQFNKYWWVIGFDITDTYYGEGG